MGTITEIAKPPVPSSDFPKHSIGLAWLPLAIIALVMWGRTIQQLSVEWTVNEQYGYGWFIPFLCGFLLWRRWQDRPAASFPDSKALFFSISYPAFFAVFITACFVMTRWIGEANPDWRLVSWALALEVIGGSLLFSYLLGGARWCKHFAFPLFFFLVAVPWPTIFEQPVIRILTQSIVGVTIELMNAFGMAALRHGNIIETAGGLVDVDEACSGIRSLQAAVMLSLFFGELNRFTFSKRLLLCGLSFALACLFNLTRTVALTVIAANQCSVAVQRWHDPAGISILVGCFVGVWAAAMWLQRKNVAKQQHAATTARGVDGQLRDFRLLNFKPWFVIFAIALLAAECGVQLWYTTGRSVSPIHWSPQFPKSNPTFREIELSPAIRKILRFNEGESVGWRNDDSTAWQMIYLRWKPGRVAAHLARNHTPDICLPAAGKRLHEISEIQPIRVGNLSLPFRCYVTEQNGRPLFVFYSLWEEGRGEQRVTTEFVTASSRWAAVLQRHRNPGQRVLEIAISGINDLSEAKASLIHELPRLIHIQP